MAKEFFILNNNIDANKNNTNKKKGIFLSIKNIKNNVAGDGFEPPTFRL